MFAEYVAAALERAKYKTLEDGAYAATVEGLRGVIAIGDTLSRNVRGAAVDGLEKERDGAEVSGDPAHRIVWDLPPDCRRQLPPVYPCRARPPRAYDPACL